MPMTPYSDLSVFEFFIAEVNDVDVVVRSEAMSKLPLVGTLMGPERVRNELIPFLKCTCYCVKFYDLFN
jgi:hypothetical protein